MTFRRADCKRATARPTHRTHEGFAGKKRLLGEDRVGPDGEGGHARADHGHKPHLLPVPLWRQDAEVAI